MRKTGLLLFLISALIFVCAAMSAPSDGWAHLPGTAVSAMEKIDSEHIRAHVRFLSHDLLEGRGTGQRGGDIAAEYIATQFALYGLKPAGERAVICKKCLWSE